MFMILLRQTLRQTNKHINGGCEVLRDATIAGQNLNSLG